MEFSNCGYGISEVAFRDGLIAYYGLPNDVANLQKEEANEGNEGMKLNITKDSRNDTEDHTGPVFPGAEERKFSYQGERCYCSMRLEIHGYPPARGAGKENHELPEPIHNHYELVINGHTGTALEVKLIGYRSGRNQIEERRANGRAVLSDTLLTSMQFGECVI